MGSASKQKGAQFERDICRALSRWITEGKREDCFWRSAMSGGRATVARKSGKDVRQAGDISANAREGHVLTDNFYIECKFYKRFDIGLMIFASKGELAAFWRECTKQAKHYKRQPMLIFKYNKSPVMVLSHAGAVGDYVDRRDYEPLCRFAPLDGYTIELWIFDNLVKTNWMRT